MDPAGPAGPACGLHCRTLPTDDENAVPFGHEFAHLEIQNVDILSDLLKEMRDSSAPLIGAWERISGLGMVPLKVFRQ